MLIIKPHLIPFLIIFGFDIMVLSEIPRPRGVALHNAAYYNPEFGSDTFVCSDGSKSIAFMQINDNFCDCPDASDEPGTSACPHGTFYCNNLGHKPKIIPSSRVNDGICDCCDASDEYETEAQCTNSCLELGRAERELEKSRQELAKKGTLLKKELSSQGKVLKTERNKKLGELELRKQEAEAIREEKEKLKKEAEALENEALQIYREAQEDEKREKVEQEAEENRREAEETFIKYDSNQDGFVDIAEIQTRASFDKNRDGAVSEEEARYFLDEQDRIDRESFELTAWPRIKTYLMLDAGLFKPPIVPGEVEHETESNHDAEEVELLEGEEEEEDSEHHEEEEGEGEEEEVAEGEEEPDSQIPEPDYGPETKILIEQANGARNAFSEADRLVREIETELKEMQELAAKDYGVDEEYAPLDGECFNYEDREYVYRLCPFDRASQTQKSGGAETRLGTWDRWDGRDYKYSHMLYSNGASCWNGPQRSALVALECGLENKVTGVAEPNRCEYQFTFQTPAACHAVSGSSSDKHDEL